MSCRRRAGCWHATPGAPLWLWGLRSGALLASEAAARLGTPVNLLFWQPVLQGKAPLQQFLRLKAAAQLADGGGKAILAATRAELAAGRPVEIAGYTLPAALAQGLEAAQLAPPASPGVPPGRLVWLELAPPSVAAEASAASPATAPALSPASQAAWPPLASRRLGCADPGRARPCLLADHRDRVRPRTADRHAPAGARRRHRDGHDEAGAGTGMTGPKNLAAPA
jgi:hypothetical protein